MTRKKVFISYAHHDATLFATRLASELEHYYETFWDNKLQAGAWSPQLEASIQSCDAFIVVMSTEREKSTACEWELKIAQDQLVKSGSKPEIIPVKAFFSYVDDTLKIHQYADFTSNYNEGFRQLTYLISDERRSAWEYLGNESAETLLQHLKEGHIPGLIARELGDWIVVDQMWDWFYNYVFKIYKHTYPMYPRTPSGILALTPRLLEPTELYGNTTLLKYVPQMEADIKAYVEACSIAPDTDHYPSGQAAYQIYVATCKFCMGFTEAEYVIRYDYYEADFRTDVAEKLRELITLYARRSRHLY